MATPTDKSRGIEGLLQALSGQNRREVIRSNKCMAPPIGCGGPAVEFDDELSRKEYSISGLCNKCQREIFGG